MSVHWPIIRRLAAHPGRIVAIDDRRSYRAAEMLIAAQHLAAAIDRCCTTSTLGVLLPASGAFPIAALAGWILGKTVVPLNFLLSPEELQYVIDDCGTDTIISVGPMLEHLEVQPKIPHLLRLEDQSFRGFPEPRWPAQASEDDLAVLLYTSGTSGRPKGVMLTHGNLASNMRQISQWVDFTAKDIMLGVLPQFHSFGLTVLTLLPLASGIRVIYTPRFVPHRLIQLLREHRPTVFVAIPSMYNALLHVKKAEADDFKSLRYVVSGGEPLPQAVFDGFRERFGITINEGYGLTETSPVSNWCRPDEWKPHSVGQPLPGVVERIVNLENGQDLPPEQEGEIRIAGPHIMKGYFKLPEQTAAVFDERGFFRTGDMGHLDRQGHLHITGRLKEMLIIGGENVFPREIEEVLDKHPDIMASGVVGLMDPIRGEVPVAFVEAIEGASVDTQQIKGFCREHLAGYKVPREIRILDQLPRNPTGKIMRRKLKELLAAE